MTQTTTELEQEIAIFKGTFSEVQAEVSRVLVGMPGVIRGIISAIFAGGHVLLEGAPGLGKTLLIKSISQTLGMSFKRIQFTPDLMPSDVTGTQVLTEDESGRRSFVFRPGPLFAHVVLADEINRATAKTQAALLEAMEERQVTVLGETHRLHDPFFVLATQNPIELDGTYPLPEAQLDRFLIKLPVPAPTSEDLKEILRRTTGAAIPEARSILDGPTAPATLTRMRHLVRKVFVAEPLNDVLVRMLAAVSPQNEHATPMVKKYVRFGPGPRGAQSVVLMAKVEALIDGRINLSFDDLKTAFIPALRHRLLLNFHAEADGVTADDLLQQVRSAK
jgi:MoxR-like ATPase